MTKQSLKSIKEELKEEQREIYGEESPGGHMADSEYFSDAEKPMEEFIGNKPKDELNLEKDIEEDEVAIAGLDKGTDPVVEFEEEPDRKLERVEESEHLDYLEENRTAEKKNE